VFVDPRDVANPDDGLRYSLVPNCTHVQFKKYTERWGIDAKNHEWDGRPRVRELDTGSNTRTNIVLNRTRNKILKTIEMKLAKLT